MIYGIKHFNNGKRHGYIEFNTGKRVVLNSKELAELETEIRLWNWTAIDKAKENKEV